MAVGQPKELEPAPPPFKIVAPREGELAPPRKKGIELSRRGFLILTGAGAALGGLAVAETQLGVLSAGAKAATNLVENLLGRTEPSKILESQYLLPTPSEDEIRRLAFIPKAWPIGEGFKRLVSPALQEQARKAGYGLTYQDNQKDAVGRTVIFGSERSINYHYYDVGFGWWFSPGEQTIKEAPAASITGVFEGWIRPPGIKPNEPDLYMRLGNPLLARDKWLIRIGDSKIKTRVVWIIDNLNVGGDPVPQEAYGTMKSFLSSQDFYLPSGKPAPSIRIDNISQLDKVIRPGDVVKVIIATKNPCQDEYGIFTTANVYLRRFGGIEQIRKEIQ